MAKAFPYAVIASSDYMSLMYRFLYCVLIVAAAAASASLLARANVAVAPVSSGCDLKSASAEADGRRHSTMCRMVAAEPGTVARAPTEFAPQVPASVEAPPVASGIDINKFITRSWGTGEIPALNDGGAEGAFRFLCSASHNSYDDPIVYPGQRGKSHLHTFFGNTKTDAFSNYTSLRSMGDGTCNNSLNRSAYWVAAMIHPSGKVIMPFQIGIYYKRVPAGSKYCAPPYAKACIALPRGLRYVFGYNMLNPSKSDPPYLRWWNCDARGVAGGHFPTIRDAAAICPVNGNIEMVVVGPNCWNGRDLDSADHRSHMAYQYYDGAHSTPVCPKSHPYLLPFFEVAPIYRNDGTAADWKLSSDIQMGMPGGTTAHADWFGAWEDSIKDAWTANCIDKALTCSGGDLGDGRQLSTINGYSYDQRTILVDAPSHRD